MAVRELDAPPRMRTLYPRALAGAGLALAGRLPVIGGERPRELPADELLVRELEIDREHVAAYCRVCTFEQGEELPVTYPHILAFPLQLELMTARSFPFPVMGLVHIANEIEQRRPLRADEPLSLRVRAQGLREHDRGTQFDFVSEVSAAGASGPPAWRSTSTYLHREGGGGGGGSKKGERTEPREPSATFRVPGDVGRRYAAVSGDRNPIHLHALSAKAFGMPRPIAHGMWMKARALAVLGGLVPGAVRVEASFKLPVPLGAQVALSSWQEADGRGFAVHDAGSGKPHLDGTLRPAG